MVIFSKLRWFIIGAIIILIILTLIGAGFNISNYFTNAPKVAEVGKGNEKNIPEPTKATIKNKASEENNSNSSSSSSENSEPSQNTNNGSNSSEQNSSNQPITYSSLSIITPFYSENDISRMGIFSSRSDIEGVAVHNGLDFIPEEDKVSFRAVTEGTVSVDLFKNDRSGNWQVNVMIDHNPWTIHYAFEPMTSSEEDGKTQLGYIVVKNGQQVKAGDELGKLFAANPKDSHIHFGTYSKDAFLCPEQFFNDEDRQVVMRLVEASSPGYKMCYE